MHLVGFIIRIYHYSQSYELRIHKIYCLFLDLITIISTNSSDNEKLYCLQMVYFNRTMSMSLYSYIFNFSPEYIK